MRFDLRLLRKSLTTLCSFLLALLFSTALASLLLPTWITPARAQSESEAVHGTTTKFAKVSKVSKVFSTIQDISISGPLSGVVGAAYEYTITVAPVTATLPIDYFVQASDKSLQTLDDSQSHAVVASYIWDTPGTKTISVTAKNDISTVMGTLDVEIITPTVLMSSVEVEGPTSGEVEQSYKFTITVSPADATGPFNFTVDATGQSQQRLLGSENPIIVATYSWDDPGVKTINVLVETDAGSVDATFDITIAPPPGLDLYMPKLDK